MKHYVLTRFNAGVFSANAPKRGKKWKSPQQWTDDRFRLFSTYTLPSMQAQTAPFHWILKVDPRTPRLEELKQMLEGIEHSLLMSENYHATAKTRWLPSDAEGAIITTRLDSDDGLHRDYLACVQDKATDVENGVIDITTGCVVSDQLGRAVLYNRAGMNFLSLVESDAKRAKTVFCSQHWVLSERLQKEGIDSTFVHDGPPWLKVYHGHNLARFRRYLRRKIGRGEAWSTVAEGFR